MSDIKTEIQNLEKLDSDYEAKKKEFDSIVADTDEAKAKKEAMSKELDRIQTQISEARRQRDESIKNDSSFQEQFKKEQLEKAKTKFFQDFGYENDVDKKKLEEEFLKLNSASIDADNIYSQLTRVHVSLNPQKYIELERRAKKLAGSAEDFLKDSSSSSFAGSGTSIHSEEVTLDQEDIEAAKFSGIPLEEMKRLKKEGKI